MLQRTVLTFAVLLFLSAPSLVDAAWQSLPAGHPQLESLVANASGDQLLISLLDAGVWHSETGGSQWDPFNSVVFPSGGMYPNYILAADHNLDTMLMRVWPEYNNSALYTYDGGQTWQSFGELLEGDLYAIHTTRHNIWFRLTDQMLERSPDYGRTWEICDGYPGGYLFGIVTDPDHDSTLFGISCYDSRWPGLFPGLMRSTDLGMNWQLESDHVTFLWASGGCIHSLARLSNGDLLMTAHTDEPDYMTGSLVLSTDNGEFWVPMDDSPLACGNSRLYEIPSHPGRVFMPALAPGGVMRSTDFGRSWQPAPGGLPQNVTSSLGLYANSTLSTLYAYYESEGVYRSDDGGDSWFPLNLPPLGTSAGQFSITPEAAFFRDDVGTVQPRQWECETLTEGWRALSVTSSAEDSLDKLGIVFDKHNDVLLALGQIADPDNLYHFSVSQFQSTDDGLSWERGYTFSGESNICDVHTLNSQTVDRSIVTVGYENDSLYYTENWGSLWQPLPRDAFHWWLTEIYQSELAIYAFTSDWDAGYTYLWRTADHGITWDEIPLFENAILDFVLFGDTLHAVLYGNGSLIHWYGGEWNFFGALPPGVSNGSCSMLGLAGEVRRLVVLANPVDSVWVSNDLGLTWTAYYAPYPYAEQNGMGVVAAADPYRGLIWISTGVGVYYLDLDDLMSTNPVPPVPRDHSLLSVYPNPFNGTARIRFNLERETHVSVVVYDLEGRRVDTMADEIRTAGAHEILFDGANLPSGTYFVRLNAGAVKLTEKALLIR